MPSPKPFDPDKYERENRNDWQHMIAGNIGRVLHDTGPFVLATKVVQVYGKLLGVAGERHVRAAVKALHKDGVIENTGVGPDFYKELIRSVR